MESSISSNDVFFVNLVKMYSKPKSRTLLDYLISFPETARLDRLYVSLFPNVTWFPNSYRTMLPFILRGHFPFPKVYFSFNSCKGVNWSYYFFPRKTKEKLFYFSLHLSSFFFQLQQDKLGWKMGEKHWSSIYDVTIFS